MKITIVGGGFGGVKAALELAKEPYNDITLISDKTDFQYYPALYSTATGTSHLESWVPLGQIFAGKENVRVLIDTIVSIDPERHSLKGESGMSYDYERCILALGSVTTYFGIEGLDTYAYGIKSHAEIKNLKHHLFQEMGEQKVMDKHYVVIGAGPTGVELAAALGTYIERLRQYYGLPQRKITIDLIEAAPRILPKMSEQTSHRALKRLQQLGVTVQTGKSVQAGSADGIIVSGRPIKSHTVIWTSGVANNPFFVANKEHFTLANNGKVEVDKYMFAAKDVYVIGDNAATSFCGLAQTALHDAIFVARNMKRVHARVGRKPYRAVMPPVVVPVGEKWAVFEWHKLRVYGWPAAMIRQLADVMGYADILPIGHALGVWRSSRIREDDYFTPSPIEEQA